MQTVALIPCTNQKSENPGPAREVWVGHHFQTMLMHAEEFYDVTYIMSFKYGLITPDQHIEPYDTNIHKEPLVEQIKWRRMLTKQLIELCMDPPHVVGIYVGKADADWIEDFLFRNGVVHVIQPWRGMGIGDRIQACFEATNPFEVDGVDVREVATRMTSEQYKMNREHWRLIWRQRTGVDAPKEATDDEDIDA